MAASWKPDPVDPLTLGERAAGDLRFIRRTMERAASFTAIPGRGNVLMGITALMAAAVASRASGQEQWLLVWMVEAAVAVTIGLLAVQKKARAVGVPVLSGGGRKFALGLAPPLVVGAILTGVLYRGGLARVLPDLWLLSYGAGIVSAGASSIRIVPVMGLCFMALGVLALLSPDSWGDGYMALGFGGIHILFGWIVARKYGG